ncbi:hypothetical protein PT974_08123 [Cladobotryum mycophilum]|uniref:DUF8004 domain-containing protein n=1 Tax=Cladobotryum mycophilum TaxID=491253 RepID=A0ABR0SCH9_9HYPO
MPNAFDSGFGLYDKLALTPINHFKKRSPPILMPTLRMAGPRPRSDSARRARGLSVGENAKFLPMKRWDGRSRTCRDWDKLRRDPEIWERNGNCLIHLYAKGESKRGPSFKLPFSALISTGCFPLIEKFLVLDGLPSKTAEEIESWDQTHPRSTVELYIPAPPSSTELQAHHHHQTIRNLLAWVLGRPMAAEHLGAALVGLRRSLQEYRSTVDTDDSDLMEYLRQAGYLNMAEEPSYALAILHLAETFRMKELYAKAFPHCVGMYGLLTSCPEYQLTSSTSRKLIKKSRILLNAQLLQTSDMLRTFLDDELSDTYLGIPPGTRAHLERFRCFLLAFYSTKLGYYPPKAFDANVLRSMATDFEALYKLLVDNNLKSTDTMPPTHVGGLCTLQLVQSFEERYNLEALERPLPQLPHIDLPSSARFLSWFTRGEKMTASQRQVTHAALIRASNWSEEVFKNDLVRAYRKFEEESILSPKKADKDEKVSVLDARKVRWIMICAVYQILRRATMQPVPVQDEKTSYHLCVSMEGTPPWREKYELKDEPASPGSDGRTHWGSPSRNSSFGMIEIKPDIDYLALTQKDRRSSSLSNVSESATPQLSRSSSFSINLRRNSTLRRSLRRLKPGSFSEPQQIILPSIPYHEIVVQGYGNGTQDVTIEPMEVLVMKGSLAGRSDSTASSQSNSSSSTASALESMSSTIDTLPSTITTPSPSSPIEDAQEMELLLARWGPQHKTPIRTDAWRSASDPIIHESPKKESMDIEGHMKNFEKNVLVKRKRRSYEPVASVPASTGLQRRYTIMSDMRRKPVEPVEKPETVRIRDNDVDQDSLAKKRSSDDWSIMQAFMDGTEPETDSSDVWAQYGGLGGLTDMK